MLVIASRPDRLGARLKNFVAAWDFAKRLGAPLLINWPPKGGVKYVASDDYDLFQLFDRTHLLSRADIAGVETQPHRALLNTHATPRTAVVSQGIRGTFNDFRRQFDCIIYDSTYPYRAGYPLERVFRRHKRSQIFQDIRLNREIHEALETISRSYRLRQAVALHIRRGDVGPLLTHAGGARKEEQRKAHIRKRTFEFAARYAPLEAYIAAVARYDHSQQYCIFSDDDTVRQALAHDIHGRSINIDDDINAYPLSSTQRAFVEMMTIARTKTVICAKSAFPEFAAMVGACRRIPVLDYLEPQSLLRDIETNLQDGQDIVSVYQGLADAYQTLLPGRMKAKPRIIEALGERAGEVNAAALSAAG